MWGSQQVRGPCPQVHGVHVPPWPSSCLHGWSKEKAAMSACVTRKDSLVPSASLQSGQGSGPLQTSGRLCTASGACCHLQTWQTWPGGGPVLSHRKVSGGADVTLLSGTRSSSVSGPVQGQGMLFPFKGRGCEPHTMEGTVQTLDRDPRSSGGLLAVRGLRHCLPFLLLNPTCAIGCKRDRRITLRYLQE